ncbi:MAG: hypothetical protein JNN07_28830 [Verrucomicrobiales bacterium]|nr:hypothetical protein [Verrucomicrobiales bacterium]
MVEETFEAFPVSDAVQDLKSGTIGATISGGAIQEPPKSLGHIDGKFALSGDKLLSAKGPITVRFTSPQSAFGLFITDAENDSRDVVLIDSKGERSTYRVPAKIPQGSSGCIFFGIIDHDRPFVAVEISGSGTEGFGFDDMMIGRIPEVGAPASTRIDTYAGLTIEGTPQTLYRIEVSATPDFVEWFTQTTIRLPTSPFLYIDPQPISTRTRLYYRAIPE